MFHLMFANLKQLFGVKLDSIATLQLNGSWFKPGLRLHAVHSFTFPLCVCLDFQKHTAKSDWLS